MKYQINIDNIAQGGLCPGFYKETYPSFGNKNMAGSMINCDLTNVSYIQQGPGLSNLGNNAVQTTLIKGILKNPSAADVTFGVGGNKLYKFSSSALTNDATFPHTIDKAAVTAELGEDVVVFQSNLYYSYNHSGSAGDIGKFNLTSTFDDDWGSTVPTGKAALQSAPHQMMGGGLSGNDVMYIANGRYCASWNGTIFAPTALDLPTGSEIQSIAWMNDRVWMAVNKTTLTGNNKNFSSIYVWDGAADSWESEIPLMGTVGALHVKNGILYVWYQDITNTGGYKLAYVNGTSVVDLANFTGGLPAFYQVEDYKDFIIWNSSGSIYAYGAGDKDLPARLFQFADGGYATVGGIAAPFGTPMVASFDGTSTYRLANFSGYDTNSTWKSLMFDITSGGRLSTVDSVRFNFDVLTTNARVDWSLTNVDGVTVYSDIISFSKLGAVSSILYFINGKKTENFRVELSYANGDITNTVKIKSIKINGSVN